MTLNSQCFSLYLLSARITSVCHRAWLSGSEDETRGLVHCRWAVTNSITAPIHCRRPSPTQLQLQPPFFLPFLFWCQKSCPELCTFKNIFVTVFMPKFALPHVSTPEGGSYHLCGGQRTTLRSCSPCTVGSGAQTQALLPAEPPPIPTPYPVSTKKGRKESHCIA